MKLLTPLVCFSVLILCACRSNVSSDMLNSQSALQDSAVSMPQDDSGAVIKTLGWHSYEHPLSAEEVNGLLAKEGFPFTQKGDVDHFYYKGTTDVWRPNWDQHYIVSVSLCEHARREYYRILVSEDVVGLDQLILVFSEEEVLVTEPFNVNCEKYRLVESSLDLEEHSIEVVYESGGKEKIHFL